MTDQSVWAYIRVSGDEQADRGLPHAGQRVALQRDVSEWDSFGRLLRHVYLPDGTWVNGVLVREGLARVRTYTPDDAREPDLRFLESLAIAEGVGGWSACAWEPYAQTLALGEPPPQRLCVSARETARRVR